MIRNHNVVGYSAVFSLAECVSNVLKGIVEG